MRMVMGVLCMMVAAFLLGCVPERVVWSPDGTQAVVVGGDGLHLCDAAGKIGFGSTIRTARAPTTATNAVPASG